MNKDRDFVDFVVQQLAPLGRVRARAMFGGYGIYRGETIFAIIVDDQLYFKADGQTRPEFLKRGLSPFTYESRGKTMTMQYYEAPPDVFDRPEDMEDWARRAVDVALRAKKKPAAKPRRR